MTGPRARKSARSRSATSPAPGGAWRVAVTLAAALSALFALPVPAQAQCVPDPNPPSVSSVTILDPGREYSGIGKTISALVTFNKGVYTGFGTPKLTFDIGGRAEQVSMERQDGAKLYFDYTVKEDDLDADGVGIRANSLAGPIRGWPPACTVAKVTHNAATNEDVKVDGVRPEVVGTALDGDTLVVTWSKLLAHRTTPADVFFVRRRDSLDEGWRKTEGDENQSLTYDDDDTNQRTTTTAVLEEEVPSGGYTVLWFTQPSSNDAKLSDTGLGNHAKSFVEGYRSGTIPGRSSDDTGFDFTDRTDYDDFTARYFDYYFTHLFDFAVVNQGVPIVRRVELQTHLRTEKRSGRRASAPP